jgi:hypothetical protein
VKALTTRSITVRGQTTILNLKLAEAIDGRDALAKALYPPCVMHAPYGSIKELLNNKQIRKHVFLAGENHQQDPQFS